MLLNVQTAILNGPFTWKVATADGAGDGAEWDSPDADSPNPDGAESESSDGSC